MSSHASTVMDRPHPFLSLPPEIITCIVDNMLEMNHDCEQPKWWWSSPGNSLGFNPLQR